MKAPVDPMIGTRVNSYLVEQLLGEGGMGVVYRGVQPEIGKRVAIKFLADEFNSHTDVVHRFFQEARAVNLIGHENIVDIFDFGLTPQGRNFFVMELLEGPSLQRLLDQEQSLPPRRTLDVALQIANALGAAHERGIVHRDLKPDNCFLVKRAGRVDFVKLLDFGIAKLTGQGGGETQGRTQTGMILGTPGYMAPEQAGGGIVDHRCDIYALGVMTYRMLAGRLPFEGPSLAAIFRAQVMEQPPALWSLREDVAPGLDELLQRMLHREPQERPASMAEVQETLAQIIAESSSGERTAVSGATRESTQSNRLIAAPASNPPTNLRTPPATSASTSSAPTIKTDPGARESHSLATLAGRDSEAPAKRGSPLPLIFAMLAAAAALAGVIALVSSSKHDPTPPAATGEATTAATPSPAAATPQAPGQAVAATAPQATPPTANTPAPAPAGFTLHLTTEPPGATLLDDSHTERGKTPIELPMTSPATFTVKLSGYRDERIDAKSDSPPFALKMRKVVRAAPGTATPGLPTLPQPDKPLPSPTENKGIRLDD